MESSMGLSAAHNSVDKNIGDQLDEVKAYSGAEVLTINPALWSWLSRWSEDAFKSWSKNPTVDYL